MKLQLFLVCALSGATASAMFRHPDIQEVPAARLIKNVSAYVAKHPHDPEGPYMLGRLNYLAFSQSTDLFHEAVETKLGDADHLIELSRTFGASDPLHGDLPQKKRLEFLKSAIRNLRKAVEMKAGEGLYWLTLGSALRDGAPFANQEPDEFASPPGKWDPAVLQSLTPTVVPLNPRASKAETADHLAKQRSAQWTEEAIFAFATAYTRSKPPPGTVQTMTFGRAPVDVEAGEAYVDLVKKRGVKPAEEPRIAEIQTYVASVKKRRGPMTPIVLALDAAHPLSELVSHGSVRFDLDGSERRERWTWVNPTTGILVWHPVESTTVTSGHQMLGAVAFQMFWRDGYAALDALDDDRDGALTGAELHGLALWFDRNSNGVSDPGEVLPVEQLGIVRVAVESTGRDGEAPMNDRGVTLRDGRVLPTYDWVAHPVAELAAVR